MDKTNIITKYKLLIDTTKGKILILQSRQEKNPMDKKKYKRELKKLKDKISEYQWKIDHI